MPHDNIEDYFDSDYEHSAPLSDAELEGLRKHFSYWSGDGPSDAAFDFWAKASYWTPNEVIALSLGKNPNQFSLSDCEDRLHIYPLCREYVERAILIARAVDTKQLFEHNNPGFALAWLDRWKISYPEPLRKAVESIGHHVADWKQQYLDVSARAAELEACLQETLGEHDATLGSLTQELAQYKNWREEALNVLAAQTEELGAREKTIAKLSNQIDQFKINSSITPKGKGFTTREQNNLLKMLISVAIEKYRYDPNAEKSPATSNIMKAIELQGFSVSGDTVRKFLRMGAALLKDRPN